MISGGCNYPPYEFLWEDAKKFYVPLPARMQIESKYFLQSHQGYKRMRMRMSIRAISLVIYARPETWLRQWRVRLWANIEHVWWYCGTLIWIRKPMRSKPRRGSPLIVKKKLTLYFQRMYLDLSTQNDISHHDRVVMLNQGNVQG